MFLKVQENKTEHRHELFQSTRRNIPYTAHLVPREHISGKVFGVRFRAFYGVHQPHIVDIVAFLQPR